METLSEEACPGCTSLPSLSPSLPPSVTEPDEEEGDFLGVIEAACGELGGIGITGRVAGFTGGAFISEV